MQWPKKKMRPLTPRWRINPRKDNPPRIASTFGTCASLISSFGFGNSYAESGRSYELTKKTCRNKAVYQLGKLLRAWLWLPCWKAAEIDKFQGLGDKGYKISSSPFLKRSFLRVLRSAVRLLPPRSRPVFRAAERRTSSVELPDSFLRPENKLIICKAKTVRMLPQKDLLRFRWKLKLTFFRYFWIKS